MRRGGEAGRRAPPSRAALTCRVRDEDHVVAAGATPPGRGPLRRSSPRRAPAPGGRRERALPGPSKLFRCELALHAVPDARAQIAAAAPLVLDHGHRDERQPCAARGRESWAAENTPSLRRDSSTNASTCRRFRTRRTLQAHRVRIAARSSEPGAAAQAGRGPCAPHRAGDPAPRSRRAQLARPAEPLGSATRSS